MTAFIETVPIALHALLEDARIEPRPHGRLGTRIYFVVLSSGGRAYLKVAASGEDLIGECRRLEWLHGRTSIPRVLGHAEGDGRDYLLISEVPGTPAHVGEVRLDPGRLVRVVASALRALHSIEITDCAFLVTPRAELVTCADRLERGLVDRAAFARHNRGLTPETALGELAQLACHASERAFTHGDCYLPNVLMERWEVSGYVDLSLAGVADPYRDIISMAESIERNYEKRYMQAFLSAYGIATLSPEKARYFTLVDQFFKDFAHAPPPA